MVKYILGIQSYANHDSGACIIKFKKNKNPEIIAISEERLLRKKYPYTFPIHSILYCMKNFGIKNFKEIDLIVSDWIREKKWLRSGPSYNYQNFDYIKEKLNFDKKKIIQISHHLAHAASTYYTSKFKSSAILIVDGNGSDLETNSFFEAKGTKIKFIENYKCHGIGAAYGAVTSQILNLGTGGEGKTMGLAPYGKFNKNIKINYEMNGVKTNFKKFMLRMPTSDVLNHINSNFRPDSLRIKLKAANKNNIMSKPFVDWAYMIQNTSEKIMINLGKNLYNKTKNKNICLAGGVALNSVANEKLFKKNNFKDIFIFPACSDAGIPFGLALWGYHNIFKEKKRIKFKNAYTGISYNLDSTLKILIENKIFFNKTSYKEIGKLISEGNIIANFFGGSEYGPRALGNRSILADPRKKHIRDHINKNIKHREIFRPFAPSILEEHSLDYFNVKKSPFMLRVTNCKKKKQIPSALHVDNTARVQTVNKKDNPNFYKIIKEFFNITGVPVVLNTSFNDAGEPLVETPLDAIISALKTNVDYLVLDKYLIPINLIDANKKKKLLKKFEKNRLKKIKDNENIALKKLTKNYSQNELKRKIKDNNEIAINNCLNKPFVKIGQYLDNFNKTEDLIIVGSNDHTNTLIKLFGSKLKKIKNIKYYEIKDNDIYEYKKKIKTFKSIKSIKLNNKNIFISSYEYSNEFINMLAKKSLRNKIFTPYDNGSRSIIDFLYIKIFKGKNKLYTKKIY
jgi:carbamoyltransferase